MTDSDKQLSAHWYIQVPAEHFPKPKFHFLQQVRSYWKDDFGNSHYEIGEIIGLQYGASGYRLAEWSYLIRLLESDFRQCLVGSDDGIFVYESSLVPDDTDTDIVIGD